MMLIDIVGLVFKTMFEKKSRVLLTISGIIIGIFTFVFFVLAAQGLSNAITEQFSSLGVNIISITPAGSGGGGPTANVGGLTDNEVNRIKQVVPNALYVAPTIFYNGLYEVGRDSQFILAQSYPGDVLDEIQKDLNLEVEFGRYIRPGDKNVIVLGAKATEIYSKENPLKVGSSLKVDGRNIRVIGIFKEKGDLFIDSSAQIPFETAKELAGSSTYSAIRVGFEEGVDLSLAKDNIDRRLNPNSNDKNVNISTPSQVIDQFNQIIGVLTLIISFISSIALVVGGINVMNTMYSNVIERINEISVLKAMGATNSNILALFLIESSILGFLGSLVGFLLAFGVGKGLSYIITNFLGYNVPIYFDLNLFIGVILITTIFASIFGTYPALKAARVNPADNLRDE